MILTSIGPSVQQLESMTSHEAVATGGTVTLSCTFSGGTLVDDTHFPWWIQHRLENVPRRILYRSGIRPSGIPDRFSGSKSGNIMSMTITGALLEDEGDYYCVAWTEDAWHRCKTPDSLSSLQIFIGTSQLQDKATLKTL
ncbi:Immunoglobulin lambda variable 8-61 [Varanus komodoensis]|nr:Immunoglobulin lambda variable 8-61 [Varanus komodoensis]